MIKSIVIAPLKVYQKWISPMFAPRCKYYPSCSNYAISAINTHGLKGVVMAAWRVVRCNPWSHGGVDYVRGSKEELASIQNSLKQVEMAN